VTTSLVALEERDGGGLRTSGAKALGLNREEEKRLNKDETKATSYVPVMLQLKATRNYQK